MLENPEKIGTNPLELLDEGSSHREGNWIEQVDYVFAIKFHMDMMTMPIPRVMGLLRQLRIDAENQPKQKSGGVPSL